MALQRALPGQVPRRARTARGVVGAAYSYRTNPKALWVRGGAGKGAPRVLLAMWRPARPLHKLAGLGPLCLRSARPPGPLPGPLDLLPALWLPAPVLRKRPGLADPLLARSTRWRVGLRV